MAKKKGVSNGAAVKTPKYDRSPAGRPSTRVQPDGFVGQLGRTLHRRRQELGLTLEKAAELTGGMLSAAMVSQYETGRMEPRLSRLLALSVVYEIDLADLIPAGYFGLRKKKARTPAEVRELFCLE